jgi:tetratricopeptide (TPR) repeat protein
MRNQDELLYYRGLTASHLMPYGEEERFAEVAIESLQEVVDHWREGSFAPDALYTLGMVHFKKGNYVEAEHLFTQLAESYPYFDKVGESWFWAAESAEWTQRDPLLVKRYRRTVFEGYPNTEHAPHAYFNYFSYADYLQGQGTAMAHLAKMKDIYPDTPYLIVVNYLQGLDLKGEQWDPDGVLLHTADISAATTAFEEARQQFDFCYEHGLIESKRLDYFVNVRYRSMLEKARGFTQVAQEAEGAKRQIYLQYAEQAYREIVADFSEDPSPLVAFVHEDVPGLGVREDAEYGLAEVYKAAGDLPAAQATVDSMLQRLKGEEQLSPYFAATVYRLSAELASLRGQPAEALDALDRAEELAGTDALPSDERLEMGILKARCYKDLGDLPRAMQLLGQVVEAEVPSPVRVQAMLERSEIYRAEGKRDLAIRQLEIAAETGGEWAERARETLDKDYALYR